VHLPSGSLHVNTTGTAGAPAIIFIHGLTGTSNNWYPLIAQSKVEQSFSVITYDLEGHGLSPVSERPMSIERCAEQVKDLMEQLQISSAIIAGHSLGGVR
jgi:pimeloyl-ACP methyl ester carboxylesterase